jgi:hypothetical protein
MRFPFGCFTDSNRVADLKYEARQHYESFHVLLDRYDCGAAMLQEISPDASRHAIAFNAAMAALEEIDPTCPKGCRL